MIIAPPQDTQHGRTYSGSMFLIPRLRAYAVATAPSGAAWPLANEAILVPFSVIAPTTFLSVFFHGGSTPGTTAFDIGVYTDGFVRVGSLGATASPGVSQGTNSVALTTPITVQRGRYYMAMSSAAITLTVYAHVQANHMSRAMGLQLATASHPLPATITPASMGTTAYMPLFGLSTISTTL